MDVLVTPLEVMDDALISELLLNNEDVLEEVNDSLFDVEMVELSDHSLLVLKVFLVGVNQSVPLINH